MKLFQVVFVSIALLVGSAVPASSTGDCCLMTGGVIALTGVTTKVSMNGYDCCCPIGSSSCTAVASSVTFTYGVYTYEYTCGYGAQCTHTPANPDCNDLGYLYQLQWDGNPGFPLDPQECRGPYCGARPSAGYETLTDQVHLGYCHCEHTEDGGDVCYVS